MHYLLFYDYVADVLTKRAPFRPAHLDLARGFNADGKLKLAGAYTDPADGAVLVFTSREAAEEFASRDPYIANGLVTAHRIREWNVVIGG
jgi:hypothetical protein